MPDVSHATRSQLLTVYPLPRVILYNAVTILQIALAGLGLYMAFAASWIGPVSAIVYLVFATGTLYVLQPLRVCPHCPYYRTEGARCISGLNLLARRITHQGKPQYFKRRAKGPLCHNNLHLTALFAPFPLLLLGLALDFSVALLAVTAVLAALVVFRIAVLYRRLACPGCEAKQRCPNAARLGIG